MYWKPMQDENAPEKGKIQEKNPENFSNKYKIIIDFVSRKLRMSKESIKNCYDIMFQKVSDYRLYPRYYVPNLKK